MTDIIDPFPYFPEAGTGGFIYVGAANLDARTNPITVYRDEALTLPWAQPIRTVDGYPAFQGAKASIYAAPTSVSLTVLNSQSRVVTNGLSFTTNPAETLRADLASTATGKGASLVGLDQGGTVQDAIAWVTPEMFGAVGDCTYNFATNTATGTDDSAAVQAAIDYFQSRGIPGTIIFNSLYRISSIQPQGPVLNCGLQCYGDGIRFVRGNSGLCGVVFDASTATANYRGFHLSGGGKVSPNVLVNRCVDKAGYTPTRAIAAGEKTITLSAGAGANFTAGDFIFIRTGQCLAGTYNEPDSEINWVDSVVGDTLTLRYPALGSMEQTFSASLFTGDIPLGSTTLTVSAVTSGTLAIGQIITGTNILPGTVIVAFGTGTGGVGTYTVSRAPSVAVVAATITGTMGALYAQEYYKNTYTATISGTIMTVSGVSNGALAAGQTVFGSGVAADTNVVVQLTGPTGGAGTYSINVSQTVSSPTAMWGGLTTTVSTSAPARFEVVNVQDRMLDGAYFDIDLIGHNTLQVVDVWGCANVQFAKTSNVYFGFLGAGSRESRYVDWNARMWHTGRVNNGYGVAPSTGCAEWTGDIYVRSPLGGGWLHLHEAVKKCHFTSVDIVVEGTGLTSCLIDILARCGDYRFDSVWLDSGRATTAVIEVGNPGIDSLGLYCDGNVSFGSVVHSNANIGGSAIIVNGANVSFDSDPVAIGVYDRLSNTTYSRNPTYGMRVGDEFIGPFLWDRQLILGTVGLDTVVDSVSEQVLSAFATGDRRFNIGYPGLTSAYVNSQIIRTLLANDVVVINQGNATINGLPTNGLTGTYTNVGTTVTCTVTAHGMTGTNIVPLTFTSGDAISGIYSATVTGVNTFTVVVPVAPTSTGNVRLQLPPISYSGASLGLQQTAQRLLIAQVSSGTTDYTAGRLQVTAKVRRGTRVA